MEKLILASNNQGKIKEIKTIFGSMYEVVSMKEYGIDIDIEETGKTFYENAYIKAKAIYDLTHETVLSDDSGLSVEALDGAPGIYSARYGGDHGNDELNRKVLLKNLEGVSNREAKFVSSVVLIKKDGTVLSGLGETYGYILNEEKGTNGFGYDCLFFSKDINRCFGECSPEEKNSVSHRYRALMDLKGKMNG